MWWKGDTVVSFPSWLAAEREENGGAERGTGEGRNSEGTEKKQMKDEKEKGQRKGMGVWRKSGQMQTGMEVEKWRGSGGRVNERKTKL